MQVQNLFVKQLNIQRVKSQQSSEREMALKLLTREKLSVG
jgi:hypothetical protein